MSHQKIYVVFLSLFSVFAGLFFSKAEAAKYGFIFAPSTANEGANIDIRIRGRNEAGERNSLNSDENPFQATVKNFKGEVLVDSSNNPITLEVIGNIRPDRARVLVPSIVKDCSASIILSISGGDLVSPQDIPLILKVNPLDSTTTQNPGIVCSEDPNNSVIPDPLELDNTLVLKGSPPVRFIDATGNADLTLAGPIPSGGINFNLPIEQATCNLLCDKDETVENYTLTGTTTINGDSLTVISSTISQVANGNIAIDSIAGDLSIKAQSGALNIESASTNITSENGPYSVAINNSGDYSVVTEGNASLSGGTTTLTASSSGLVFVAATDISQSAAKDIILESGENIILKKPSNANTVELALAAAPSSTSIVSVPVNVTGTIPIVGTASQTITVGAGTSYALNSYVSDLEVTDGTGTAISQFTDASYPGQVIAVAVASGSANITFNHSGCVADGLALNGAANFVATAGEALVLRRMRFPATCWVEIGRI